MICKDVKKKQFDLYAYISMIALFKFFFGIFRNIFSCRIIEYTNPNEGNSARPLAVDREDNDRPDNEDHNNRIWLDRDTMSLGISPLEPQDSGEYLCLVNNRKKPQSTVKLLVQGRNAKLFSPHLL